jgi:ribose-phosphate pyrophosphokinase
MSSLIFSGRSNSTLTKSICRILKKKEEIDVCGDVSIQNFPSGETYCQYQDNIRGKDVFIVQATNNPNEDWMELFLLTQTARLASANKITAVIPYFSYARQDRKSKPRSPISARLVLDLLQTAGATRIITLDLHNISIQGFSSIPLDTLLPCNLLIDYFKKTHLKRKTDTDKWVIFSPDVGGIKKIEKYAESFGMDFGMIHKKRLNADKVEQKMIIGSVKGKNILMIDDMSESLGTLSGAAKLLKSKGAKKIVSFVTHLPLTEKGKQNLEKERYIDTIVTTNSIEGVSDHPRVHKIDIAPMLSDAISRTMNNKSISSLFDIKGF